MAKIETFAIPNDEMERITKSIDELSRSKRITKSKWILNAVKRQIEYEEQQARRPQAPLTGSGALAACVIGNNKEDDDYKEEEQLLQQQQQQQPLPPLLRAEQLHRHRKKHVAIIGHMNQRIYHSEREPELQLQYRRDLVEYLDKTRKDPCYICEKLFQEEHEQVERILFKQDQLRKWREQKQRIAELEKTHNEGHNLDAVFNDGDILAFYEEKAKTCSICAKLYNDELNKNEKENKKQPITKKEAEQQQENHIQEQNNNTAISNRIAS